MSTAEEDSGASSFEGGVIPFDHMLREFDRAVKPSLERFDLNCPKCNAAHPHTAALKAEIQVEKVLRRLSRSFQSLFVYRPGVIA
jgi:hypothetical protein